MKIKNTICFVMLYILMLCGFVLALSANWYVNVFGDQGFAAVLFTLSAGITGTSETLRNDYFYRVIVVSVVIVIIVSIIVYILKRKNIIKKDGRIVLIIIAASIIMIGFACVKIKLPQWIINKTENSTLYEDEYVNPSDVSISFPEKRKNLIYIILESMETTFLSEAEGGAYKESLIPELYELARDNVNFSHNNGVGGWPAVTNTTWTMASIVAQYSGIPLSIPVDGNAFGYGGYFLPGLTTLNDILSDKGYNQAFLCGSDSTFGGRSLFFEQHNVDKIYDYYSAIEDEIVPKDYLVWWGIEEFNDILAKDSKYYTSYFVKNEKRE